MPLGFDKFLNLLRRHEEKTELKININGVNEKRYSNAVITSKYTVFNFLFLNLYEQFHKISNIYFFFIGVLQTTPSFSATNGIPTVALPLSIVLCANAIKDAYEDWKRHVSDQEENNKICYVISSNNLNENDNETSASKGFFASIKKWFTSKNKETKKYDNDNDKVNNDLMKNDEEDEIYSNEEGEENENYFRDSEEEFVYNLEEQYEHIEGTIQKHWKDIVVGDIILCNKSDFFCADILLLGTSDTNGIAFVETSSLDGETNLKVKQTNGYIFNLLGCDMKEAIEKVKTLRGFIISDIPNKDLSVMYGTIYLPKCENIVINKLPFNEENIKSLDNDKVKENYALNYDEGIPQNINDDFNNNNNNNNIKGEKKKKKMSKSDKKKTEVVSKDIANSSSFNKIPFDAKQFLLRGCKLKNTDWIIGIVIYTGKETKIQMNSTKPIRKTSQLERLTNKMTIIIWIIQMSICLISAIYNVVKVTSLKEEDLVYLPFAMEEKKPPIIVAIISFFSWVVITGNFVPISLVVTMSFVKVIQAYFIASDETMIHKVYLSDTTDIFKKSKSVDYEKKSIIKEEVEDHKIATQKNEKLENVMQNKKIKESNSQTELFESKMKNTQNDVEKEINLQESMNKEFIEKTEEVDEKKENVEHGLTKGIDASSNHFVQVSTRKKSLYSFNETKEKNCVFFNAVPRTSSLIEELGQIEYIFSDKTGTLTCNFMEFRKCAVNGISYGKGLTEIKRNILKKKNIKIPDEPVLSFHQKTPHVNIVDDDLVNHLKDVNHFNHAHLIYFFIHLAINHAVISEKNDKGEDTFASSSPDEEAFVYAAKHLGIQFLYRRDGKCGLNIFGKIYEIETLASVEFSSQRKMSSIICRIPYINSQPQIKKETKHEENFVIKKNNIKSTGVVDDQSNPQDVLNKVNSKERVKYKTESYMNLMKYDTIEEKYNITDKRELSEKKKDPSRPSKTITFKKMDNNDSKKRNKIENEKKKRNKSMNDVNKISVDVNNLLIEDIKYKWKNKSMTDENTIKDVKMKLLKSKKSKKKYSEAVHMKDIKNESDLSIDPIENVTKTENENICDNENKHSKIVIFCKGAGTVILKKLKNISEVDKVTISHMETYADEGLRTLCIAKRELSEDEFAKWYELYKIASCDVKDRDKKIEQIADIIEKDLTLQGVTGIEDKLQEGVSSTIEDLRIAGIHIWMLTGDKIETAINIGIAANLIDHSAEQFIYTEDLVLDEKKLINKLNEDILKAEKALDIPHYQFDDFDEEINEATEEKEKDANQDADKDMREKKKRHKKKSFIHRTKEKPLSLDREKFISLSNYANQVLIVDGTVIDILLTKKFEKRFFYLADKCTSVICGRISPYQKGAIVMSAIKLLKKITLAIGDGANDRNMINRANIGIGIRGLEGVQAFNASDYGIGQFRFLKTLLLVHGRLSYRRISKLVVYMFYKNIVLTMPLFFFGGISLYSGQKFYYEFLLQMYNVFFTSFPVIVYAILDQDINIRTSLVKPVLYRLGIYHYYFNIKIFVAWVLNSTFHAVIVFLLPLVFLSYYNIPHTDGLPFDIWEVGCATFFLTVLIVNFKMLLESYYLNALPIIGVFLSILSFLILSTTFSFMRVGGGQLFGTIVRLVSSLRFWLVVIVGIMISLTRDYLFKVYKRNFNPEIYHILQEQSDESLETIWDDRCRSGVSEKRVITDKLRTFGYAFSEADPACINIIRKQDKMI